MSRPKPDARATAHNRLFGRSLALLVTYTLADADGAVTNAEICRRVLASAEKKQRRKYAQDERRQLYVRTKNCTNALHADGWLKRTEFEGPYRHITYRFELIEL